MEGRAVDDAVVGRVEGCGLDVVAQGAPRGVVGSAADGCRRGAEHRLHRIDGHLDWAVRWVAGGRELVGQGRIGGHEARRREGGEALGTQPAERTEGHRVVGDASRCRGLDQRLDRRRARRRVGDADVGAVAARPGGGHDLLAGAAQLHPQRLRSRRRGGAERIQLIAADRRGESADAGADRRRDGVEGVERDVVVRSRGARRDRDVRDRGHRWRDRDVLLGHDAVGLETAEPGLSIEDAGLQIVLDEVRLSAVERDHDHLRLRGLPVVLVVFRPSDRRRGSRESDCQNEGTQGDAPC